MKEISDIIKSYDRAVLAGRKMALATVVHVEGSSYRRPGARMLVTDDGQLTGAISGGCLEGDALRKALLAITQGKNKLVTYDTTDESDPALSVQLGCNGIVHILFEPIDIENKNNPIELLRRVALKRQHAIVITLFKLNSRTAVQPGTCFLQLDTVTQISDDAAALQALTDAAQNAQNLRDSLFTTLAWNENAYSAFVEYLAPAPALIIVGAGNDTIPLAQMASVMGWKTTIVDGRPGHATPQRFPMADDIIVARADEALSKLDVNERTFFTLMTHNYHYDLAMLKQLVQLDDCRYIGALGPKKKLERMFSDLLQEGITLTESQKNRIYGPVGLDIGAETSEEIALSVLAEIKAVLENRRGAPLREKPDTIHSRRTQMVEDTKHEPAGFTCAIQTTDA